MHCIVSAVTPSSSYGFIVQRSKVISSQLSRLFLQNVAGQRPSHSLHVITLFGSIVLYPLSLFAVIRLLERWKKNSGLLSGRKWSCNLIEHKMIEC